MSEMLGYNKLIRDKVPGIIAAAGKRYEIRKLDRTEYLARLKEKLQEEVDEYLKSEELEELADILEVVRALVKEHGVDADELEEIRVQKAVERGGFEARILLVEAEE